MPNSHMHAQPMRRLLVCAVLSFAALASSPVSAQDVSPLTPNEAIDVPGGSFTVLALDLKRGEGTVVTLRVRALAGPKSELYLRPETFRLLAAGVPRVPATHVSYNVAVDSAEDFELVFKIPDRTDDLVLQARFSEVLVKRRLPRR
jgi:hypothetical protein